MSRSKAVLVLTLILGLGGLCFYLNRDWFAKSPIQVSYRVSPWLKGSPRSRGKMDLGVPIVFSLDRYHRLTSVKVVKTEELATNRFAHALWELTTESNSIPLASFSYGQRIPGMRPAVKAARPDPLEPYVMYRLLIKTTKDEAQHDFTTTPIPQAPEPVSK